MTSDSEFNTIRPYCDSEIEAAIERLCKSEEFLTLFTHLTKMDRATIQGALQGIRSRAEFQAKFFGPAIQSLINTTTELQYQEWNWSTKILLIFLCPIIGISFLIRPS